MSTEEDAMIKEKKREGKKDWEKKRMKGRRITLEVKRYEEQ